MASLGNCEVLAKRKKVVLTVEKKLEIIELLHKKTSYTVIAEKYGIGRSTITDIKNSKAKLQSFKEKMKEMGLKEVTAKSMKIGAFEKPDEALYIWFRQQREKDVAVNGSLLQEKVKILHGRLYPDTPLSIPFSASSGFKWRFCKRHNLRSITMQGKQGSADIVAACEFKYDFEKVLAEYSTEQTFNCDETGLQYRLLPQKTLVSLLEKRAEGRKKCKDRVTICACAKVTGTIKLPLLFIGKSARPRCFTRYELNNLPVVYKSQKNAWVNCINYSSWFHDNFVPFVQDKLRNSGKEPKALLIMDNCSAHPDEELLISRDGLVKAMFLPPNVTSLIQPMD